MKTADSGLRFFLAFAGLILFQGIFTQVAGQQDGDLESISIQLKWRHQFQFAGYYAAMAKGYYHEEGLDVSLFEGSYAEDVVQDVLDGKATYGTSDSRLLYNRLRGDPVVLVAQIFQHSPEVFLSRKESGITTPHDMIGKRVMWSLGELSSSSLMAMVQDAIGGPQMFISVPHDHSLDKFVNGDVDVISAYLTDQPYILKQRGIDVNIINPRVYGIEECGDNLFTSEKEIINFPGRAERVRDATIRGWKYALDHPEEIIQLIHKEYAPDIPLDLLTYEARLTGLVILPELFPIGSLNKERFREMVPLFRRLGLVQDKELDDSFFYEPSLSISLSTEESAWLQRNSEPILVRIGNRPPWEIKSAEPSGLIVDYLNFATAATGVDFQFIPSHESITESIQDLKDGKGNYDLIPIGNLVGSELPGVVSTSNFNPSPIALYVEQANTEVLNLRNLSGKSVSTGAEPMIDQLLHDYEPGIKLVTHEDIIDALMALARGEIDAVVGNQSVVNSFLQKAEFSNIRRVNFAPFPEQSQVVIARPEFAPLISILDKVIEAMPTSMRFSIRNKWINSRMDSHPHFDLTTEERLWIENHPKIRLGFSTDFEPMLIRNSDNSFSGTLGDIVSLIEERLPLKIEIVDDNMGEIFKMVESGKLDGVLGLGSEKGKELGYLLTKPHSDYPYTIFSKAENAPFIRDYSDLAGRKVAIARGNVSALKRVLEAEPTCIPIEVDTVLEGMRALYTNEVYAFAGHSIWNYQIVKYQLSGIKPAFFDIIKGKAFAMAFAVNRDWPEFVSIVNKTLASIPPETIAAINHRWSFYEAGSAQPSMGLSQEEQAKLWTMDEIFISSLRNWPPFDIVTPGGIYEGLSADYLNLLSERIGIPVNAKLFDSLQDVLDSARNGETVGVISIAASSERENSFFFTDPLVVNPVVGITNKVEDSIKSWNDLNGKTLILVRDHNLTKKAMQDLENVTIVSVDNEEEGLNRLVAGDGDIYLGYIGPASYQMNRLLLSEVKIAFKRELAESHLRIAINKDHPLLASIFNKAVQSITQQEHLAIQRRWLDGNGASVYRGSPILPEGKGNGALVLVLRNSAILFLLIAISLIILWEVKGRPRQISIRHTLFVVSFIFSFLIIAIAACATLLLDINEKQDKIDKRADDSRDLANEIRESTEEMSDYASFFAVTGNPKYEELYWLVNSIREGEKPHPEAYNPYYWDMLTAGYIELDEKGETYSIADKINSLGLPPKAQLLINKALESLKPVMETEVVAINAVKGLYRNESGEFTRQSQPDLKMARSLLYGLDYQKAVADILQPIEEFMIFVDWTTAEERNQVREYSQAIIFLIGVLTVITIVFSVYTFILLKRRILSPLSILEKDAHNISEGIYDQITPLDLHDEIGTLSRTFRSMALSIQERTQELKASESRMQFLLSSSPVVIYSRSIKYPFTPTYITPNIESVIGLTPGDFSRDEKFWVNNIHPEERDRIIDDLSRIQKHGNHTCEYRFRLKDGDYHWLLEEVKLVLDQEGKPSEMIGYWLDISQRKKTESELKKLSRAVDQGPAIVMITDNKASIQYVNPAFTKVTGYSFNEAVGNNPSILKAGGILPKEHYGELWRTITSGGVWHGELCNRKKNNEIFWEAATIAPVFQDSGKISHYVALKVDITDRKKSEDAVKRQNERLRSLQQIVSGPEQSEGEVLQSILRESCRLLNMERAYLARLSGESCVVEYAHPLEGEPKIGDSYSMSAICCGIINEQLPPIMEHDLEMSAYRDTECCFKLKNAAFAGSPLKTSQSLYGMLGFTRSTPRPTSFDEQDQDFLEVISGLSGAILERMSSKEELIARANELEALNENMVDREMRVISLKEKVNDLSRELGHKPPYETVWINEGEDEE